MRLFRERKVTAVTVGCFRKSPLYIEASSYRGILVQLLRGTPRMRVEHSRPQLENLTEFRRTVIAVTTSGDSKNLQKPWKSLAADYLREFISLSMS
jgi:hypothetical protein